MMMILVSLTSLCSSIFMTIYTIGFSITYKTTLTVPFIIASFRTPSITASIMQGSGIGPSCVVEAADLNTVTPGNMLCKYANDTFIIIQASNSQHLYYYYYGLLLLLILFFSAVTLQVSAHHICSITCIVTILSCFASICFYLETFQNAVLYPAVLSIHDRDS